MHGGVRIVGDLVVKPCRTASGSAALVERTRLLQSRGLKTPPVRLSRSGRSLCFHRIDGETAQVHLLEAAAGKGVNAILAPVLKRCLEPVAALHASNAVWAARYQPFRLIDPRMEMMAGHGRCTNEEKTLATSIRTGLSRIVPPIPVRNCVLHGDLHPGQIILERAPLTGAWLIDLDDMCCGDPEADLGNLVAHLLTSGVFDKPVLSSSMNAVMQMVCSAYERNASLQADKQLVAIYGLTALLRRALKLMLDRNELEAGRQILQFLVAELSSGRN